MSNSWLLLLSPPGEPSYNMALDEALLRFAANRARPLLRLYRWDRPAVTFGYFQKFPAHLASQHPTRRPTGGGIVYHGDGVDTTYTVVIPPGHPLHVLRTEDAYCALHKAIAAALALRSQISNLKSSPHGQYECFQNPVAGDVVTDTGDKLAGAAQRRGKSGMLHQGSIATQVTPEQIAQGFRAVLHAEFTNYAVTPEESALADQLAREKYSTHAWNHRIA